MALDPTSDPQGTGGGTGSSPVVIITAGFDIGNVGTPSSFYIRPFIRNKCGVDHKL